jgi:lipoyl(octanoyl) transferase
MQSRWYGLTNYCVGLELQQQAHRFALQYRQSVVIGLEHEPVITLGKRAEDKDFGETKEKDVEDGDLKVVRIDRGGQATLHSPGQLVIYPVLALGQYKLGVADFVETLHQTTALLLHNYGIETTRNHSPGLYTEQGKIAFFGIRIEKGVSRHGLAINVSNDLALFRHIRSCGVENASLDKMSNHGGRKPALESLFSDWTEIFKAQLGLTPTANFEINNPILLSP